MRIRPAAVIVVTLILSTAMGVSASGVLSAEEMSVVQGGCVFRTKAYTCMPDETCETKDYPGSTWPCDGESDCTSRKREHEGVTLCSELGTGTICTPVAALCGKQWECNCETTTRRCHIVGDYIQQNYEKPKPPDE